MSATPGKRMIKSSGKRNAGNGSTTHRKCLIFTTGDENCCCAPPVVPCPDCCQVTFSEVVRCICAHNTTYYNTLNTSINRTWLCGKVTSEPGIVGADCIYKRTFSSSVSTYASTPCTGSPTHGSEGVILLYHLTATNKWVLDVKVYDGNSNLIYVFYGTDIDSLGTSPITISNDIATCGSDTIAGSSQPTLATAGTAEVVFNCDCSGADICGGCTYVPCGGTFCSYMRHMTVTVSGAGTDDGTYSTFYFDTDACTWYFDLPSGGYVLVDSGNSINDIYIQVINDVANWDIDFLCAVSGTTYTLSLFDTISGSPSDTITVTVTFSC